MSRRSVAMRRVGKPRHEWNVPMTSLSTVSAPMILLSRTFISFAALLVNVTTLLTGRTQHEWRKSALGRDWPPAAITDA